MSSEAQVPALGRQSSSITGPTSRSSTVAKRTSTLPKPSSLVVDPSAIIAQHASLTGSQPITIGASVVLHPHSKITSSQVPVLLGDAVLVYEKAVVGVQQQSANVNTAAKVERAGHDGVVLGNNVVVESGAVVEAAEVGEGTVVEAGAHIGSGAVIGKFCTVAASSVVPAQSRIPDFTVVYADFERRIDTTLKTRTELQQNKTLMHRKQVEVFRKLIPNNVAKWQ